MTAMVTSAKVRQIVPLTDSIIELILEPYHFIDYQPGQYLQLLVGDEWLSYSIANAPLGARHYELHIRHDLQNTHHQALFADIKQQGKVTVRLPFGECHLSKLQQKPIIFMAAGTGFAPINAMIEQLLAAGDRRSLALYWSARSQSDLYLHEKVIQWQAHVSQFQYFSLLPEANSQKNLAELVISHYPSHLSEYQFVIGGPFDMVFATRDALVKAGITAEQMHADAFSFEQKKEQ